MRRPRQLELRFARELAEVVMVDAALQILDDVLVHEHPCIEDPAEHDPPALLAARRLAHAARSLRSDLARYRRAVLEALHSETEELPF